MITLVDPYDRSRDNPDPLSGLCYYYTMNPYKVDLFLRRIAVENRAMRLGTVDCGGFLVILDRMTTGLLLLVVVDTAYDPSCLKLPLVCGFNTASRSSQSWCNPSWIHTFPAHPFRPLATTLVGEEIRVIQSLLR